MHCPSCGLRVRVRAHYVMLDRCPRCLARRGAIVPMEVSDQPAGSAALPGQALSADPARSASGA
jgi:hypothetical protein